MSPDDSHSKQPIDKESLNVDGPGSIQTLLKDIFNTTYPQGDRLGDGSATIVYGIEGNYKLAIKESDVEPAIREVVTRVLQGQNIIMQEPDQSGKYRYIVERVLGQSQKLVLTSVLKEGDPDVYLEFIKENTLAILEQLQLAIKERFCLVDVDYYQLVATDTEPIPQSKHPKRFHSKWVDYSSSLSGRYDQQAIEEILKKVQQFSPSKGDTNDALSSWGKDSVLNKLKEIERLVNGSPYDHELKWGLYDLSDLFDGERFPQLSRKISEIMNDSELADLKYLIHQLEKRAAPPTLWNKLVATITGTINVDDWKKVKTTISRSLPILQSAFEEVLNEDILPVDPITSFNTHLHEELRAAFELNEDVKLPRVDKNISSSISSITIEWPRAKVLGAIKKLVKNADRTFIQQTADDIVNLCNSFDRAIINPMMRDKIKPTNRQKLLLQRNMNDLKNKAQAVLARTSDNTDIYADHSSNIVVLSDSINASINEIKA